MSWPAMSLYLPSRRKPVKRTTISFGFCLRKVVSGSRPSFSRTPGRKGSMRTSAVEVRERRSCLEVGFLRSSAMEDLSLVRRSVVGGPGRSMRRTEAP